MQTRNTFLALAAASFLGASSFTQAAPPQPSNKYDGSYFVTQVELGILACQTDETDINPDDYQEDESRDAIAENFPSYDPVGHIFCNGQDECGGLQNTFIEHFQKEQQSTIAQRSGAFVAESSGGVLFIPAVTLNQVEIRMDGTGDVGVRDPDGAVEFTIAPDGSILPPAGIPDSVTFVGQFSADGALFQVLITGVFAEEECQDSFSSRFLGISRDIKGN